MVVYLHQTITASTVTPCSLKGIQMSDKAELLMQEKIEKAKSELKVIEKGLLEKGRLVSEWDYTRIVLAIFICLTTFTVLSLFILPHEVRVASVPLNPLLLVVAGLILYGVVSLRKVDTDRIGGADFFGRPLEEFKSGLKVVPRFILGFVTESSVSIQAQFPGDADRIFWADEKSDLPTDGPKLVRPIFAKCAEGEGKDNPLERQLTVGMIFYSRHQLKEGQLYRLIKNIGPIDKMKRQELVQTTTGGNVSDRMLEVIRQLRDTGERVLKEITADLSVADLFKYQELVNQLLKLELSIKATPWGITLVEAGLTYINLGHQFNDIMQLPAQAEFKRQETIKNADGTRYKLTEEGLGAAAAEKALLVARGEGFHDMAKKLAVKHGPLVVSAETARQLATSGNVVVAGESGVANLIGLVAAGTKTHGKVKNDE